METLLGGLFGGVFRMLPELLKWLDRKDERKHELSMFDKQLEADKLRGQQAQLLADTQAESALAASEIQALIAATEAQGTVTGVKWVDAINALMRPVITFWWVIVLYTSALIAQFTTLIGSGMANAAALLQLWGTDEKAIVFSIISFWFVDRSLRKGSTK